MAYSNAEIVKFLIDNPQLTDAQLADIMETAGVDVSQVAEATQSKVEDIQGRFETRADEVYVPPAVAEPATTYEEAAAPVASPLAEPVAATVSAPITSLLDLPKVLSPDEPPAAPIVETVAAPIAPVKEAAPTAPVEAKISKEQIVDFLVKTPNLTDAELVKAMETYKLSPADIAKATVSDEGKIAARVAATLPPNQAVLLGDTYVQAVNTVTGSGEDQQTGGLENVITYKASENKVGGDIKYFSPEGKYEQTTKQQEVNANKDFGKFLLTAGTLFGLPAGIGEAVGLGTGATANAVGTGLLSSGSAAIGGADLKDIVKAGVLGGGASLLGSTVSDLLTPTVDASKLTAEQLNDIINEGFATDLKKAGVKNVTEFTTNVGGNAGTFYDAAGNPVVAPPPVAIATPVAPPAAPDNLVITDAKALTPSTVPSLSNVIAAIGTPPIDAGTVNVEDKKIKEEDKKVTIPTVPATPIDTLEVVAPRPVVPATPTAPIVPTIPLVLPTIPATPPAPPPPPPKPPAPPEDKKPPSVTDIIKIIAPLVLAPAVVKSLTPDKPSFPIVPIPPEWTPPPVQPTTPFQPLTPIDFGDQNLLKGTQWEKFLDPNYGKVPTPRQYSQPSNLSYNDLMGILGSKQGMPPTSSLSINDVISGIQNQYGQVPSSAMGQKPA